MRWPTRSTLRASLRPIALLFGLFAALSIAVVVMLPSCSQRALSEAALGSAYRPPQPTTLDRPSALSSRLLLAGDLHCHVRPPDGADVTRDLERTVVLAREQHLDFVTFTPHVPERFFADPVARARVAADQAELRAAIAGAPADAPVLIAGFEYTDPAYGHVGVAFADLDRVLAAVPLDDAKAHPEHFFEQWVASGGTLVLNHPLVTPLDSIFAMARYDLSWRAWTGKGPFPSEIVAINRLAQGAEALNVPASTLRDRVLLGDGDHTLVATFARVDREIVAQHRRITPVGGSDSHGDWVRATTYVLAEARTAASIHDAIVEGRVCVRSPEACSFEARTDAGSWRGVGDAIEGARALQVRAHGDAIEVLLDGEVVARPASDEVAEIAVDPARCSVLRAHVDTGFSAPIYVGCGL